MILDKEMVLNSIQTMPDKFSIAHLFDRLLLMHKLEEAIEQSKKEQGITFEEAKAKYEKWLK